MALAPLRLTLAPVRGWVASQAQRKPFVAKYGRQFYEGFRAFYYVCVEAFAANDGEPPSHT